MQNNNTHTPDELVPAGNDDIIFTESTLIIDSDTGEFLGGSDEGTYHGKSFTIVDYTGDGIADVMAYDANGNGVYEDNEIQVIDDDTYIPIGNADDVAVINTDDLEPETMPASEPEVIFTDSTLIIDSDTGELAGGYDEGTIDGKSFAILDNTGDGIADVMAYDENANGRYESQEIHTLGDDTFIPIGNAKNVAVVTTDEILAPSNDYAPDGHDDLAHQNPDYNNKAMYSAGYESNPAAQAPSHPEEGLCGAPDNSLADDIPADATFDTADTTGLV